MEPSETAMRSPSNGKGSKTADATPAKGRAKAARRNEQEEAAQAQQSPRELGTPREEMERNLLLLLAEANRPGITPTQKVQLLGAARHTLKDLVRLKEGSPIHEHPDFDGLVEDLTSAVVGVLGAKAPAGIELEIADRFLELQNDRATKKKGVS